MPHLGFECSGQLGNHPQYKDFAKELPKQRQNSDVATGGKRGIGIAFMVVGALITIGGYNMDTTVSSGYGRVHNVGLMNEKSSQIQMGGIFFISGVILYSLNKKNGNS